MAPIPFSACSVPALLFSRYEMKSSQFHYEAHKNNQLLRSSQDFQSMYNYRRELESASKEFQEHSKPTHLASL